MVKLSERVKTIKPSATLKIDAKAKQLKKEGVDVVSFGAGEPDFDTPEYIKLAAIESIKKGETKYTPASGILELKEAIVEKLKKDNNLNYKVENILISCGAKHSIYNVIQALVDKDDEVIIFSPYWVSYPEQIKLASGEIVVCPTEHNDFNIDFKILKEKINSKTKLIIINSPQNPSGCVYELDTLQKLVELLLPYEDLYIISDEIYEKIIFDNLKHISIAQLDERIKKRTIIVNGMSKSFAMTGWRIGYIASDKEIIDAINNLQSHSTSNPTTFCQTASVVALKKENESDEIKKMLKEFSNRRDIIFNMLNNITNFKVYKPKGAFYIFPDISYYYGRKINGEIIDSSVKFCEKLLENKNVAAVPGVEFGCDNFIRLSFATSIENIKKGVERIKEFVLNLK